MKYKVTQEYIIDFSDKEDFENLVSDYKSSVGRKPKTPEDLAEYAVASFKILPCSAYNMVEELEMQTEQYIKKAKLEETSWEMVQRKQ